VPAVSKRAKSVLKAQITQPASLYREADILIALLSIQRLLSDNNNLETLRESLDLQKGLEKAKKFRENREDNKLVEIK
jgi:hypothetical protein